ncbi:hypothetical protein [Sphingobacterium thermophilum]
MKDNIKKKMGVILISIMCATLTAIIAILYTAKYMSAAAIEDFAAHYANYKRIGQNTNDPSTKTMLDSLLTAQSHEAAKLQQVMENWPYRLIMKSELESIRPFTQ